MMRSDLSASDAVEDHAWPQALRWTGRHLLRVPRHLAWLPPLAWAGLIFALSSYHAPLGKPPGSAFMALFMNLAHAFEFGVLLLLLVPLLPRSPGWVVWSSVSSALLMVLAFAYAVTDEIHQSRVPGRDASLLDLCTDLAGIVSVYLVVRRLEEQALGSKDLKALLGRALLVCCLCAGAATLWGAIWEEGPWPF